jgi:uncharacterized protein (DUF58 family)
MVAAEILKKVRGVALASKTALSGSRAGGFKVYASGTGYDFDQLREYQSGDDVRRIDWKSSARSNSLLLRDYKDERNRTLHVILDLSPSMEYGSQKLLVSDVARELAAALMAMGSTTDDALGLHYVSAGLEKSFAPRSGEKHMMQMMHSLERQTSVGSQTSLKTTLEQFGRRYRRRSLVFLISDFIDEGYETALRVLARRHEVAVIRVRDCNELKMAQVSNVIACEDSEHAQTVLSDGGVGNQSVQHVQQWRDDQLQTCNRLNIPCLDCTNDGNHIESLMRFVRRYF